MRNMRAGACVLAVCCVATSGIAAGAASRGELGGNRCVAVNSNAKVVWTAPAGASIRSARVYFRSTNAKSEHFVEMRPGGGTNFVAILPKPAAGVTAVDYRIATAGLDGAYATKSAGHMTIAKTCTPDVLSAEEARQANAIVVGLTSDGPVVPIGFRCDGIVGEVDAKGQLRAYSACSEITTAILRDQGDAPSVNRSSTATVIASKGSPGPSSGTHSAAATGQGLSVGPLHHRTPRRAPNPAAPPNPRLQEPVSNSRP